MMIYAGLGVYPDDGKSYKIADQILATLDDYYKKLYNKDYEDQERAARGIYQKTSRRDKESEGMADG